MFWETVAPRWSREGEMPMTMVKSAPLASQGRVMNEKTDVGIVIRRVELVVVAMDNIGNGWW